MKIIREVGFGPIMYEQTVEGKVTDASAYCFSLPNGDVNNLVANHGILNLGTEFLIIAQNSDYYQIYLATYDIVGFISKQSAEITDTSFISTEITGNETCFALGVVANGTANFFVAADGNTNNLVPEHSALMENTALVIIAQNGEYYKVKLENENCIGYILKLHVNITEPKAIPTENAQLESRNIMGTIANDSACFFVAPNGDTSRLVSQHNTLNSNEQAYIMAKNGAYYKIMLLEDNSIGYVNKSDVRIAEVKQIKDIGNVNFTGAVLGEIASGVAFFYNSPRKDINDLVPQRTALGENVQLVILAKVDDLFKVKTQDDGLIGYVQKLYVNITCMGYVPTEFDSTKVAEGEVVNADAQFYVLPNANSSNAVPGHELLRIGTAVDVIARNGDFYKVKTQTDNLVGYVLKQNLHITLVSYIPIENTQTNQDIDHQQITYTHEDWERDNDYDIMAAPSGLMPDAKLEERKPGDVVESKQPDAIAGIAPPQTGDSSTIIGFCMAALLILTIMILHIRKAVCVIKSHYRLTMR